MGGLVKGELARGGGDWGRGEEVSWSRWYVSISKKKPRGNGGGGRGE